MSKYAERAGCGQKVTSLCVPLIVGARQLGLFRQLQVDIDACIMSLPQGDGSGEPGILIGLPSLLESGLLTSVLTGDTNLQRAADSNLDADPIEQWETMGRDEIGRGDTVTVQSVNQGTAFALPTVDGSNGRREGGHLGGDQQVQTVIWATPSWRIQAAADVD